MASEQPSSNKRKISMNLMASADIPNAFAHLGVRFCYTFVAWIVLGKGINETSFFVSLNLFVIPILMDCLKFSPTTKIRICIRAVELIVCSFWFVFSVLGMMGVFVVAISEEQYILKTATDFIGFQIVGIDLRCIWWGVSSVTFVTLVDWLYKRTRLDVVLTDMMFNRTEES